MSFEGYDTWKTGHTPWDDLDAWESDEVDKEAFYADLSTWRKEQVDDLETDEEKDALMHKFWLKDERDKWEEMNRDRIF